MRIGIVGGGIVGTALAATLQKLYPSSSPITIIDDYRPHQTSKAGQGYLWSIHRAGPDLKQSLDAKRAWVDLLSSEEHLLHETGSLLICNQSENGENLYRHYTAVKNVLKGVKWVEDARSINPFLLPSTNAIYYPEDYTCSPSSVIDVLKTKYNLQTERRTVHDLSLEAKNYDVLFCCAGPWTNSLVEDIKIVPLRGLLLTAECNIDMEQSVVVPMMEFGYGGAGVHFTLSLRDNRWLVGASREDIGFSMDDLDVVQEMLLGRSNKFVQSSVIGDVKEVRVGYRPYHPNGFGVKKVGDVIVLYGFEGQGVLYAALAAKRAINLWMNGG